MLVLPGHSWGQKFCFKQFQAAQRSFWQQIHLFHKAFTAQTAAFNCSEVKPQLRGEFSLSSAKPRICTTTFFPSPRMQWARVCDAIPALACRPAVSFALLLCWGFRWRSLQLELSLVPAASLHPWSWLGSTPAPAWSKALGFPAGAVAIGKQHSSAGVKVPQEKGMEPQSKIDIS